MNIQLRLPSALLLVSLGVLAAASPVAAQTISSGSIQTFGVGQPPTAISAITVTDAATATIRKTNGIRIRIPATLSISWNTALTTATITGTGASKVSTTVSYEDGGKTLVLKVTTNFTGGNQIIVSGLQYMSFATASGPDGLQLVVSGAGGATAATDSRTIQILAPTMASAASQFFVVGQLPAAISPITLTDAALPTITAANDIRIRIPATLKMSWNTGLTTATLTGSAAGKVSTTVSYADGGKTLVLDVTSDFAAGDQIVVDGLEYQNFTTVSAPDYLQLVVSGTGGVTNASDSRTIEIVGPSMASAANQSFVVAQAPTAISAITITDAATATITAANDLRIRIPATLNMTWNTAVTTATLAGTAAGKVSPTVSYEDGGKTLVLAVTSDFAANDQIVVSGLQYQSFSAPAAADNLELVVSGAAGATNASDSRTFHIVTPATMSSAANQVFVVAQAPTAISPITLTDDATPTVTAVNDIRIRIPATLTMTWNTALTTATLTGSGAGKVAPTVSYEDGGKTLVLDVTSDFAGSDQLVVSGLQYQGFTAVSAADHLQLAVTGPGGATNASDSRTIQVVRPAIASTANQVFAVGQAATAIAAITVTDGAAPSITAANDIRIRIPATFNMTWNAALTTATLTGSAATKVSPTVSYEDGGKTLVLNVTGNFAGSDQVVVSGLQYSSFTAPAAPDSLQLVVAGPGGSTVARDSRTIQIVQATVASAANQVFVVGQAATAMSAITITGTGATKVATTVSYEDGGKTLRLDVTSNFTAGQQIVVSGLQYRNFTAPSATDSLQLVISGAGGGTAASDSRTIQIVQPTLASAANQVFVVGQAATAMSAITVTDAATA